MDITPEQANAIRKECGEHIARRNLLDRLEKNPDFQSFIKVYLEDESVRLVHLYGEPSMNLNEKRELHREEIHERLIGIARFAEYLRGVRMIAQQAEKQLQDLDRAEAEAAQNAEVIG